MATALRPTSTLCLDTTTPPREWAVRYCQAGRAPPIGRDVVAPLNSHRLGAYYRRRAVYLADQQLAGQSLRY